MPKSNKTASVAQRITRHAITHASPFSLSRHVVSAPSLLRFVNNFSGCRAASVLNRSVFLCAHSQQHWRQRCYLVFRVRGHSSNTAAWRVRSARVRKQFGVCSDHERKCYLLWTPSALSPKRRTVCPNCGQRWQLLCLWRCTGISEPVLLGVLPDLHAPVGARVVSDGFNRQRPLHWPFHQRHPGVFPTSEFHCVPRSTDRFKLRSGRCWRCFRCVNVTSFV